MINYEFVEKCASTRMLYKLDTPLLPWKEYEPLTETYKNRKTEYFVVSLGRFGDTAIFPATSEGSIVQFDALHWVGYWITDYDEFIQEWLGS